MKNEKILKIAVRCLIALVVMLGINAVNLFRVHASSPNDYGVVGFVSSLSSSGDKNTVVAKTTNAGFGWVREEYTYADSIDFAPYDSAYSKIKNANLKILGLLTYPGSDKSHAQWKDYVKEVVGHFPGVSAWEIMNEADNYLSAADYAVFLKEANEIIKGKGSATVVCSGLTARKEVYPFWDGLKSAGAWDSFDVVGLHMFHDGTPYEDSYNNGTLSQEVQKVINTINDNGGGKSIWVTELGYDSDNYGSANQASWMVESLKIIKGFSEVGKVFVFRLYDHGNGLGLLNSSFGEKEVYGAVKNWLANGSVEVAPPPTVVVETPQPAEESSSPPAEAEVIIPKVVASKDKSSLRLDGKDIVADGKEQFRIVVTLMDNDGVLILDQKPGILLTGGQTELNDFTLVGNEWMAYISSNEEGERVAQISLGEVSLGELKMVFSAKVVEPIVKKDEPVVKLSPTKKANQGSNHLMVWYIGGGVLIFVLVTVFFIVRRRHLGQIK